VWAILDEGLVCHLGVVTDLGPVVLPTAYVRSGDRIYLHGARANAALLAAVGKSVCVTVTLVDGLVLARSAFNHSMNYRSVVIFGVAHEVTDPERKRAVLTDFVEHVAPGRSAGTRAPTDNELRATLVMYLPLVESSAKVRTGPPHDDPADMALPYWAGVVPLSIVAGPPEPDEASAGMPVPEHAAEWRRPTS
jgi:nitroimidazol reductase NimA-like FMN-containing flavoprotein (pyridoxamine 5'-phosphate oxidase superfamily)